MIFPISDTQVVKGHRPIISHSFVVINILIFIYEISLGAQADGFVNAFGVIPRNIVSGEDLYTLITSIFLHGGWMHLIGNMIFLWIFGDNIEATIGSGKFLLFYISGGLIASLAHILFNINSDIPSIGASGAIAAIMGAYLVMFPKSKVTVVLIIFFTRFTIPAVLFLGIWFLQQLLSGIGSIGVASADTSGVAWWAHIGGFIYGVVRGMKFKHRILKVPPSRMDYV